MIEYIKREDVLRILENGEYWPIGKLEDDILHLEAEDVVEVVRCRDCRHITFSDCYGECGKGYLGIVQPNDFCSRGEHKEAK